MESFWDTEIKEEEPPAPVPSSSSSFPQTHIDVNRLKPRVAQPNSIWKENNPAEWLAIQRQGELVAPQETGLLFSNSN